MKNASGAAAAGNQTKMSRSDWAALGGLAALVFVVFADAVFGGPDVVASSPVCDAAIFFPAARAFGFGELAHGNLPLWNPHVLSGTPYLGSFQAALLYPPNMIYLFLPLARAINVELAGHVLLLGVLMFAWARARGLRPPAAFFAAATLMFSSPFFLRVLAGHLTMLDALAWSPLVFLAIDKITETPRVRWCIGGALAITMQILAGAPQVVFCTGIAAGVYGVLRLIGCPQWRRALAALAMMACLPVLLGAAQLWPALDVSRECTRAGGLDFEFASSYSLPPENLATLLVPGLFGDFRHIVYWGRQCRAWEVAFYIGITGLLLAILGAIRADRRTRWTCLAAILALMLIALGKYTPIFGLIYHNIPGFSEFRGPGRFVFFIAAFLALLAGMGAQTLLEGSTTRRWAVAAGCLAGGLGLAAAWLILLRSHNALDTSAWSSLVSWMENSKESSWEPGQVSRPATARIASYGLLLACVTCVVLAALLTFSPRSSWAAYGVLALGVGELLVFARMERSSFQLPAIRDETLETICQTYPGDYRILDSRSDNNAIFRLGGYQVWGYDPVLLRRFAEFMAYTQGRKEAPTGAGTELAITAFHGIYKMLRCGFMLTWKDNAPNILGIRDPLPRFLLLDRYQVISDRDTMLTTLCQPGFNPRRTVLLEKQPSPTPAPGSQAGNVTLAEETTDSMVLDVQTPAPAILLITDVYSKDWRARPLAKGPQKKYEVMPGDYVLRAIPLNAGQHRILVEYAPLAFRAGKWVSVISCTVLLVVVVLDVLRRWKNRMDGIDKMDLRRSECDAV